MITKKLLGYLKSQLFLFGALLVCATAFSTANATLSNVTSTTFSCDDLYGVSDGSAQVYKIDTTTGVTSLMFQTNYNGSTIALGRPGGRDSGNALRMYLWPYYAGGSISYVDSGATSDNQDAITTGVGSPFSGGEVNQLTGEIYYSGGDGRYLHNSDFYYATYDPATGTLKKSLGGIQPKTGVVNSFPSGGIVSSDMAIDAEGNLYSLVHWYSNSYLVKVYVGANNTTWYYEIVANVTGLPDSNVWGMAFLNGQLFATLANYQQYSINVLTGVATKLANNASPLLLDYASCQVAPVIKGSIYLDSTGAGNITGSEDGLSGIAVQLWKNTASGPTFEKTYTTTSTGDYSFIVDSINAQDYYIRILQPKINGLNATQSWASSDSTSVNPVAAYCDAGDGTVSSLTSDGACRGAGLFAPDPITPISDGYIYTKVTMNSDAKVANASFALTTASNFGDAPSSYNNATSPARHIAPGASGTLNTKTNWLRLGDTVAVQTAPQPSDAANLIASHDGIEVTPKGETNYVSLQDALLVSGNTYTFRAKTMGPASSKGYLNGWIDWSSSQSSGSFGTTKIVTDQSGVSNGYVTFDYTVPSGSATTLHTTYARFRFSTTQGLGPNNDTLPTPSATVPWVVDGEVEDYRLYITPGTVKLSALSKGNVGTFSYALTNVSSSAPSSTSDSITTVTDGTKLASSALHAFSSLNQSVTITQTLPSDDWEVILAECLDGSTPITTSLSGNVLTIPASSVKEGASLSCTFTNGITPKIEFAKAISGTRLKTADQFTVQLKDGSTVSASSTTTGTATTATTGATKVKGDGTVYTLDEIMATGSSNPLTRYDATMSCTNTYTTSTTTLPSGAGKSFTVTPGYGDNINCTLTNVSIDADVSSSIISASPTSIIADGVTESTVTVQLKDSSNNDITTGGDKVEILFTDTANKVGIISGVASNNSVEAQDNGDGTYTVKITSVKVGSDRFTFKINDVAAPETKTAEVTYTAGSDFDETNSTISADPDTIDADNIATSTVKVTMYYSSNTEQLITGYTDLALVRKDGTDILGTVTYIGETNGVYSFSVKSPTVGSDEFAFKTTAKTSTKSATVSYTAGTGKFDQDASTISANPVTIDADGIATSTVSVTMYYASDSSKLLTGYEGLQLVRKDGTDIVGTVTYLTETNGVYTFSVKSGTVGSDEFAFKTTAATSTKSATVSYTAGTGDFDQEASTISASPTTIDADGIKTSTVSVTMYYASDSSKLLTGYEGLQLVRKDGTDIVGTVTYLTETNGVYTFSVKSGTVGSDEFAFKTAAKTSTKSATVSYTAGTGDFDQEASTISASPTTIDADGIKTSTVSVTMYYASDSSKLITGYEGLQLLRKDGTTILGTVTYIGETNGVYTFSVKSGTVGSDEFVFKTAAKTSTKSATVSYTAGTGDFDQEASTISASPTTIDADGIKTSTVSVTMYYASDSSKLITGYEGLQLVRKDGTDIVGTVTYLTETNGVYTFSVKSGTVGSDEFVFKTAAKTSTKSATVSYTAGTGDFDQEASTISASPTTIDADGIKTSTVSVTMYYASDSSKLLTGYEGLQLVRKDGTDIVGTVTYLTETNGVYTFSVKSGTVGSDEFAFKTAAKTSTKSATVSYTAGTGDFDQEASTISASPTTIDADGIKTSTVSVTMYYASDSSKLITGYEGLQLVRKDGTTILGTVTYIGETNGVYTFSVKSGTVGSDEFAFKTAAKTSTKSATVSYTAGTGDFDQEASTISASPTTIDADGIKTSTVSVTMYYASDSSKLITGYEGLQLVRKDGTDIVGTVTYLTETNGVYTFSVKSPTVGSDEFAFKTTAKTSTKSATVSYTAGTGDFDQEASTITAIPTAIDADGIKTSTVSVTMYYASDSSKLLTGYEGLQLVRKDGTTILGTVTYIGETNGVYTFSVKSGTVGSDEFAFKTAAKTSTKSATVSYTAGTGDFDQEASTISASPTTIDADGIKTSTVSVTMYYASDSSKLITGYEGLQLVRKDGTTILGTVTYIGETNGVYTFSVKSGTVGSDEFAFKTAAKTSTKSATVSYTAGTGDFDQEASTISASPTTIDADGIKTSTVSVTMYYASDSSKLITGYEGLQLLRKDGTTILGTVTYIGETSGVYTFSVKSGSVGSDEFVFKTAAKTSTKSTTVNYTAGTGDFDQEASTISASPTAIDADGVATSTVSVTMYYASDSSKLITGYAGLQLVRKDGTTILGTVTYIGETNGVYTFSVKSGTIGSDEFAFKTTAKTSTKTATVAYGSGGAFDQEASTITANPETIDADGVATSTVSVTMYYASDSSKLLTGYEGLQLVRKDGTTVLGTVTYIGETNGVYTFSVKSGSIGSDQFAFKTTAATSNKTATVTYGSGGTFDQEASSITANPVTIEADGVKTSTVSVTMYYASDSSKLLTGYEGLQLVRKDGTTILGTVTYIGETNGVYTFSVKSGTVGSDEFAFKTTAATSTKTATVSYTAGTGDFDQEASTISASPTTIDADGVATSTVSVTMYYASDSSKLITGYEGLQLVRKDGTDIVGTVTYLTETNGVYTFSVKSGTVGNDEFAFKTTAKTSTKTATVSYTAGTGKFDETNSTISADPVTIDADNIATSTVSVTMYYESDPTKLLTGYEGLQLVRKDSSAIVGTVTYIGETNGVYTFSVKSPTVGSDEFVFKTSAKSSTKSATVSYTAGTGKFDETNSTISAIPVTIDADNIATSTVSVTMYYASDPTKLLTGYEGLQLVRKDGTDIVGTVTYLTETNGVYTFSVKSGTVGSDEFAFKTAAATSTKTATVSYTAGTGKFDETNSTISADPTTIDADGIAISTVSVTMYYASDSSKLLTGYEGLQLVRKDGTDIVGTVTYIGETNGVYTFGVKSGTVGSDEFAFKTEAKTSTKTATVSYTAGTGKFDETNSTISADPTTIDADGIKTSTVSVTMYYASAPTKLLTGYEGLQLVRKDGSTIVGTVTYVGETNGVYTFSVKSGTVGSDEFAFKTTAATSTKTATVSYTAGKGEFDQEASSITADPVTIDADGIKTSIVSVTMYYESDPTKLLTGYEGIQLVRKDGGTIVGTVTYIGETSGVYTFSVKSGTVGSDEFVFKTASKTSTKSATVSYTAGTGKFDETNSTISADPTTIDADGIKTSTVSVTMYYESDPTKLLTGYEGLQLVRKDGGTIVGTVTYLTETNGVYTFSVKSGTVGSDEFAFKTTAATSTKTATVSYTAGTGKFDQTNSTISASPTTIDADNIATSTVSVTMYYESDPSKLLTGYEGLQLVRKDGTDIVGTVTYIGETSGVYTFSVKSGTVGSDEFAFKTTAATSTKTATVSYTAGSGKFDETNSTISATPVTIDADNIATSTVSVTMYYESDPTKLLTGYEGLQLVRKDGTDIIGTVTYTGETNGVYTFSVKSGTVGSDEFAFKTTAKTSTKTATVSYTAGSGKFDETNSTIIAIPVTIDADNIATSTVSVTMYYESDPTKLLTGYEGLQLVRKDGGTIVGTVAYTGETNGVYTFSVKSGSVGSDEFAFKTTAKTSTKTATVSYTAGEGKFDQTQSTIVANPITIDADNIATSTVSVTMYYESDPTKLLTGYEGLQLVRTDGTDIVGTVTYTGETNGVYTFSVKSGTVGSDEFAFKTQTATSTKTATVSYTAGEGKFDQTLSSISADPVTIDADNIATSTVSVTMYYESDPTKLLTGYEGLQLVRKDGGTIVGIVTYTGETNGVYTFSVQSGTVGSDEFAFKTTAATSTKTATVSYTAGEGKFDQTKSTIVAEPVTIDADNITESTVSITMYYESDPTKLLTGYSGLELVRKDGGTIVGTVTYTGETNGVYTFSVKSGTVGSDEFAFKTSAATSTKTATVSYTAGTKFDTTKSTIVASLSTIAADNIEESVVTVELFYASDNSKRITGLTSSELSLFVASGTPIGTFTPADTFESSEGVYQFIVKSDTVGSDAWQFKTGSTNSTATATINYETDAELLLTVSTKEKEVKIGDVVLFTITAENKGKTTASGFSILESLPAGFSYVANSAALTENPRGNTLSIVGNSPLSLENLSLNSGEKLTLKVILRVGAGVKPGTHKTYVEAFSSNTIAKVATARAFSVADTTSSSKTSISNRASATLIVSDSDPLFSESLIVGTVYHDRNGNGIQDADEPGIPGVKIVSAQGLIITTDQYGRYHLEGISGGKWDRGRNYILKVDPSSLPEGTNFVSNNPLVRRITPGLPVRFDFGVQLPQAFIMEVSDKLFENGKSEIKATYTNVIKQMAEGIKSNNIKEVIIVTEVKQPLSIQREDALRALLNAYLGEKHAVIVSSMNSAKGAK